MLTLTGSPIGKGTARGRAFVYTIEIMREHAEEAEEMDRGSGHESERMRSAFDTVGHGLEMDARHIDSALGSSSGDIFRAQSALMNERSVIKDLDLQVNCGAINAETAVRSVFATLATRFRASPSAIIRARGDDVEDVSRRLLLALRGIHAHRLENIPAGTVIVANRLLPSDTVFLSRSSTVAIIAEFAGPAAHAALLARELGIPCVAGVQTLMKDIRDGDDLLVDGDVGIIVVSPDTECIEAYRGRLAAKDQGAQAEPAAFSPTTTQDGCEVRVYANARSRLDVEAASRSGAYGIGLFRTEPFFMANKHLPSVEEFSDFLIDALEPMAGKPITIRLLDIGADKMPLYLHLPIEPDPFLGLRGVRVLLRYPQLLQAQAQALLTVSQRHDISVLIPMLTTEEDAQAVVQAFRDVAREHGITHVPPIGGMIETPAAALIAADMAKHLSFLSIGSNDLTQYTLAAGRENPSVIHYFIEDHPAVLRLIGMTVAESGIPVSICGELAGNTSAIPLLLRLGLRSFSVAPSLISEVRQTIRINATHDLSTHV
jgi:phosphoenolpyruvate-protein phosphotransferase